MEESGVLIGSITRNVPMFECKASRQGAMQGMRSLGLTFKDLFEFELFPKKEKILSLIIASLGKILNIHFDFDI